MDLSVYSCFIFHGCQPGCLACQKLNPVLDYLEGEWEREEPDPSKRWFKLAKVDVEKNPRLKNVSWPCCSLWSYRSLGSLDGEAHTTNETDL